MPALDRHAVERGHSCRLPAIGVGVAGRSVEVATRMVELLSRLESGRHESLPSAGSVLSVFDFDGTLTRHDSFLPFLWFAFGTLGFLRRLPAMLLPSLAFFVHRISRDELKACLITVFLRGIDAKWLSERAQAYCRLTWGYLLRPEGVRGVTAELDSGAQVTLCSASPVLLLRPFAERLGVRLIGTELEVVDGRLTGRIVGGNCRAENKVLRLQAEYGPLTDYRLRAWGDTQGDHALLRAAQDPHWRVFHPRWRRTPGPTRAGA